MKLTPTSKEKEINGVEAFYHGVKLIIARDTNIHYKNALRRLMKPYQREIDKGTLDDATTDEILCTAIAEGILVGWDASTFPNGIEYTKEKAKELMLDDEDCRRFVLEFAADLSNYLEAEKEAVKKE